MKMEMHISVPKSQLGNSKLERRAQIILWGYEDPIRWAVYNEQKKSGALRRAREITRRDRPSYRRKGVNDG